eukprot:7035690-Prorocentrum_lima.AAC.1
MTSSLVGSEMCIRDRHQELPSDGRSPRQGASNDASQSIGKITYWIEPVSYTHLTLPTICSV